MENTAFHQEYYTLLIGIRSGVDSLAIEAFAIDLVCEEVKNKATSQTSDRDTRARAFLDGVQDRIKTDQGAFYKFVGLLREQAAYEHLAKKLETRKRELDSHPKSVAESTQRYDAATYRGMPSLRGSRFSVCPSDTGIGSASKIRPFLSPPLPRRSFPYGYRDHPLGPRPISGPSPSQKTEPHPLELDPSSVRLEGDTGYIESPGSFSSISTDGEDLENFSSESSELAGNEITVHTTAPTPVSEEQSISDPCKQSGTVPEQEQGNMATLVADSQSHSGNKPTVTIPQRSNSTDSNEFVTPPTSPQPGPIQESSTEGASTTALAGGDYSQPKTYHHRQRIKELEEKLSKNVALLRERERELRVSEETKRQLLRKDKQRKDNKKLLRDTQSKLEAAERKNSDQQAALDFAYHTIKDQQREISELEKQLKLLDTKAYAYDEIRKREALEKRLEEVQRRLDMAELQHNCMTQQSSY